MKFLKLFIVLIFTSSFIHQAYAQRYLQPVFSKINKTINIKYGSAINYKGAPEDLLLDVFQPEGDTLSSRPLVIMIHGGGFVGGNKENSNIVELCNNFAKRGYVTTSINYRLDQSVSAASIMNAMHDAKAAVRFFRRYASLYRVDTNRIVIGGGSAGAYTALSVSYINKEPELLSGANPNNIEGNSGNPGFSSRVQACIDLWGALIYTNVIESVYDPPLIIIHGTEDKTVLFQNALDLDSRANQVGLYHEFYPLQGLGHGPWEQMTFMDAKIDSFLFKVLFKNSTGLIPINDLGMGYYKSYQGGLYPDGKNIRPLKHDSLGLTMGKLVKPLDINGNMDSVNGKIVLLSIGMSNTTQEFSFFKSIEDTDRQKNPKLIIVDGAQGGQTASIISNPASSFWNVIETRLQSSGVNAKQVQVCWIKEADANPNQTFPIHTNTLRDELLAIIKIIRQKYPNCKMAYLSSRIYGGYATTSLNPEPYAYESGFSVKWLIEMQIKEDTSLICTGNNPKAPWLAWGPYLWADGISPRSDGFTWIIDDFKSTDGTHPSTSGVKKVADELIKFFKTDPSANLWFLKNHPTGIRQEKVYNCVESFQLFQNYPNPFNPSTNISFKLPVSGHVSLKVYDILGREVATLVDEFYHAGTQSVEFKGMNEEYASGIYFYQIRAGNYIQTKKMIVLK